MKSFVFPGNIEDEILAIGRNQIPYMRTSEFSELVIKSEKILLKLIDCPNGKIIPYTGSGTTAMDSVILSYIRLFKKVLVINGGTFGERWKSLCDYYGINNDQVLVDFGGNPDITKIEEKIKNSSCEAILMQHHETSSGYLYDLNIFSELCKKYKLRLIVDTISSFLTDELSMNKDSIDIALLSSQKGLNIPPGLSFVVISERLLKENKYGKSCFYYDWNENLLNLKRGQTPYSPATQLFLQLNARLLRLEKTGIEQNISKVSQKANYFRNICNEKGWLLSAERKSNCITGVYLPFDVFPFAENLAVNKKIYIMPSLRKNLMRINHAGILENCDYLQLIDEIIKWEKKK